MHKISPELAATSDFRRHVEKYKTWVYWIRYPLFKQQEDNLPFTEHSHEVLIFSLFAMCLSSVACIAAWIYDLIAPD